MAGEGVEINELILEKAHPRLVCMWQSTKVSVNVQHKLLSNACTSLNRFCHLTADKGDLRK